MRGLDICKLKNLCVKRNLYQNKDNYSFFKVYIFGIILDLLFTITALDLINNFVPIHHEAEGITYNLGGTC